MTLTQPERMGILHSVCKILIVLSPAGRRGHLQRTGAVRATLHHRAARLQHVQRLRPRQPGRHLLAADPTDGGGPLLLLAVAARVEKSFRAENKLVPMYNRSCLEYLDFQSFKEDKIQQQRVSESESRSSTTAAHLQVLKSGSSNSLRRNIFSLRVIL